MTGAGLESKNLALSPLSPPCHHLFFLSGDSQSTHIKDVILSVTTVTTKMRNRDVYGVTRRRFAHFSSPPPLSFISLPYIYPFLVVTAVTAVTNLACT